MEQKNRLRRIAKANSILGYICVGLALLLIIAFIVSLLIGEALLGFFILIYIGILFAGIIVGSIIASIVLSVFEVRLSKELGTFGKITPKKVLTVMNICNIFSLIGVVISIVFEAIIAIKDKDINGGSWQDSMVPIFMSIALVGCLVQAIFNSVYVHNLKQPKVKKSH